MEDKININVISTADLDWENSITDCSNGGELIFGYKNTVDQELEDKEEKLYQIIVKRSYSGDRKNKYSVSIVTTWSSYMYNLIPVEYLQKNLIEILENLKVDGAVLAHFKQVLEDLEK